MERWTDIGPLLKAACADLKVGELLAVEAFSLFEAMSALEAGNPKMDAAASPSVERPTLEALLADPSVAPWDLPESTLLEVLDQLLAMEASWHCGGSAMQTVYACLYMLKLDGPQQQQQNNSPAARALYAYCRALQCDCALVRDLVMSGAVCEEEDINVFTGGLPFEPPTGAQAAALEALDAAIAEATTTGNAGGTAAAPSPSPDSGSSSGDTGASSSGSAPSAAAAVGPASGLLGEAVAVRLRLRRALHLGLRQGASRDPQEVITAVPHFQEVRSLLPKIRESSPLLLLHLAAPASSASSSTPASADGSSANNSSSSACNGACSSSMASGSSSPLLSSSAKEPSRQQSHQQQLAPGFQMDVNKHLLGTAPPRQVKILSITEALSYMERMVEHLLAAVMVSEHVHDYRSLQLFLWRFARLRPGAVARSVMHSLVMAERWQAQSSSSNNNSTSSTQAPSPLPSNSNGLSSGTGQNETQAKSRKSASKPGSHNGSGTQGAGTGRGGKKGAAAGGGGGGRKGCGKGGQTSQQQQQQQQHMPTTPAWVPTKEMIASACRVQYKAGLLCEEAELFFEQALIASSNMCQAMLVNRCRSRRRLRRCLDDWYNMYHHGLNADVAPAFREHLRVNGWRWRPLDGMPLEDEQGPLSSWAEIQSTMSMLHHLLLGFELDLYEPLEYDMIYWYCDFLCSNAAAMYGAILQRCPPVQPPKPPLPSQQQPSGLGRGLSGRTRGTAGGGSGSGRADSAAAAVATFEREQLQLRYEITEVEVMQLLCQGMLRLMVGLRLAGSMPEHRSPPPFNSAEQRFEQRFAAFANLPKPPPLTHVDYINSTDPGDRDAAFLLTLAAASFKEARLRCGALVACAPSPDVATGWVRGLERVAATNAVVAGVLRAKLADGGSSSGSGEKKMKWECDWSLHPYFPAVTLPKAAPAPAAAAAAAGSSSSSSSTALTSTAAANQPTTTTITTSQPTAAAAATATSV